MKTNNIIQPLHSPPNPAKGFIPKLPIAPKPPAPKPGIPMRGNAPPVIPGKPVIAPNGYGGDAMPNVVVDAIGISPPYPPNGDPTKLLVVVMGGDDIIVVVRTGDDSEDPPPPPEDEEDSCPFPI